MMDFPIDRHHQRGFPAKGWSIFLLIILLWAGCIERTIQITSTPPGAEVFLDGQPIGRTPVEIPFVHYGERRVLLRKRHYIPLENHLKIDPPFYQLFPLDFVSEVLLPYPFQDIHSYHFSLKKNRGSIEKDEIQRVWKRAEKAGQE